MTIIAFDTKTLVADSRCTRGDASLVSDNYTKLFRIKIKEFGGNCVVGFCGCPAAFGPFINHLEKNGLIPMEHFKFNNKEEEDAFYVRGLAVNKKGQCFEFSVDGDWYEVTGNAAIGSGEKIALHEMNKGCDALEAVIQTCSTELTCGGNLLTYEWATDEFTQYDRKSP